MKRHTFYCVVFSFSPLIAKSDQIKQTRISSLLSQLALSSQNKFFLKSPPKAKKKPEVGLAEGSSDADLVIELDAEADSSESLSPTSQYENVPSALLDCAISDLVSLDPQAEVEQGIFLMSGKNHSEASGVFCVLFYTVQSPMLHFQEASSFPP